VAEAGKVGVEAFEITKEAGYIVISFYASRPSTARSTIRSG